MSASWRPSWIGPLGVALLAWLCAAAAWGQLPATQLGGVYPAGGTPGAKFDVTVSGANLDSVARLHFSHPGITAEVKMAEPGPFDTAPQPVPNQFVVSIAADVPPGQYDVRSEGLYGLSNPRVFEVNTLPEQLEVEPNNELSQANATNGSAPYTFNGQINGATDVDWIRISAAAGERILVNCLARRVDSRLDAVIRVEDSNGKTLAEARDSYASDPLLDFVAPAQGDYFIVIADALYAGGPDYTYRLQIGRLPYIDYIFPPAGLAGTQQQFTIYGRNLPGGQPSNLVVDGRPLDQLLTTIAIPADTTDKLQWNQRIEPHQSGLDAIEYRLNAGPVLSNPFRITVATAPIVFEQEPNNQPQQAQQLSLPCEVAGQFYPTRDADWYTFTAKQAEVIWIDVYSQRLGWTTDPSLVVQQVTLNEKGEEQTNVVAQLIDDTVNRDGGHEFDTRSGDPAYRFVAPTDGTYRIYVRDSFSGLKKDPRLVYRLALRREQPDFRLAAVPADSSSALFLRKGGRESIRVIAFRQDGFNGEIRLSATGMPAGVTASEAIIGPASNVGVIVITAADGAPAAVGALQIVGKAIVNGQEVTRTARCGAASLASQLPQPGQLMPGVPARLTREMLVSVSAAEVAGVAVDAGNNQMWETARGGILKIPYTVRRNGFNGAITGMITDLPPNFNPPQVGIGGGATAGEIQINLNSATPTGTYSFVVNGFVQGLEYRRNPDAAQAAAARKTQLDQVVTETSEKLRVANELAAQAQRTVDESKAAVQTATNNREAASKTVADAETALKAAMEQAAVAVQQAAANPNDAGLAQAAATAAQVVTTATPAVTTAKEGLAVAEKALADTQDKLKVAEEAKAKADQEAKAAMDLNQLAMQIRQAAEQRAQQLTNEAQPRQVNYWTPSTPIVIRVAEYPITLDGIPESVTVKQGAMAEVPLRVTRLFGFDQNVNVQAAVPGAGGLQINGVDIQNGQTENKLVITAAANATPGTYDLQITVRMNFNGNGLELQRAMKLIVEEVKTQN